MPTQHTASPQKSRGRAQPKGGARSRAVSPSSATDERDDTYALISVIYHALQGAETLGKYIGGGMSFGSEAKVLFKHPEISPRVDTASIPTFLAYRYVPGRETLFAGIECLPPASWLRVSRDGLGAPQSYWDYSFDPPERAMPEAAAPALPEPATVEAAEPAAVEADDGGTVEARGGVGGEPTLDELIVGAWEGLTAQAVAACPVCDAGVMRPVYADAGAASLPVAGRCTTCGTTLS